MFTAEQVVSVLRKPSIELLGDWPRERDGEDPRNQLSFRKNVEQSLERYEANISDRLTRARTDDRFSGGGSEQVPEAYRQIIAKYFESLARKQR